MTVSLVTGGAGFIGSHLVNALLERGDQVRVLDNFSTGSRENLAAVLDALTLIEGDLRDPAAVQQAVEGADYVFHLAAYVSAPKSMLEPQVCFDINVAGTLQLFEAARRAGVRQVVIASSAAVYGDAPDLPLQESTPVRPLSPYGTSKQVDEAYASLYTLAFGLPVASLRFFNVFGPRQSPQSDYAAVIPIFIRRLLDGQPLTIYGDGLQKRDFVYVGDVVRALMLAAGSPQAGGQVFNVCSGREVTLLELIEILGEFLSLEQEPQFAAPRPGDIYRSLGSPEKAAQVLGFRPQVGLQEGLRQTAAWMGQYQTEKRGI